MHHVDPTARQIGERRDIAFCGQNLGLERRYQVMPAMQACPAIGRSIPGHAPQAEGAGISPTIKKNLLVAPSVTHAQGQRGPCASLTLQKI